MPADPRMHIPVPIRIRKLRRACRYSMVKFARILGVDVRTIARIESLRGRHIRARILDPDHVLPRLRIMERAFARQLKLEYEHPSGWGKLVRVYKPYNGNLHITRMDPKFRGSRILPDDKKYIELLGGMAVFGHSKRKYSTEED